MDDVGVDGLFWIELRVGCWSTYRVCKFGRGFGKVKLLGLRFGVAECEVGAELRFWVGRQ